MTGYWTDPPPAPSDEGPPARADARTGSDAQRVVLLTWALAMVALVSVLLLSIVQPWADRTKTIRGTARSGGGICIEKDPFVPGWGASTECYPARTGLRAPPDGTRITIRLHKSWMLGDWTVAEIIA